MVDALLEDLLLLKFIKEGRLINLILHIPKTLLPLHARKISCLVHFTARLHLIVELIARGHGFLDFLLLPSLTHVLCRHFIHILEVKRPFLAVKLLLVLQLSHLIFEELLNFLVLLLFIELLSVFLDSELSSVIVNMFPPEAVLLLLQFSKTNRIKI